MCDTLVSALPGEPVWLAKNSDREPDEAQSIEWHAAGDHPARRGVACTHLRIPQVRHTRSILISRPTWMWGAEMGINERGLAIANEAVFTRENVAAVGLTGMDLLRLALERSDDAESALALIIELIARYPQGGRMGHRDLRFRYHSAFVIADPSRAWLLETAGRYWAARRIEDRFTTSNLLTIAADFDRIHPEAYTHARKRGWCRAAADFDFARCYGAPFYRAAAGGELRRACTARGLAARGGSLSAADFAVLLTDHAGGHPRDGIRMQMACAHASFLPTRRAGQTTSSMIARLTPTPRVWVTGTSSPCLSVFKPIAIDADAPDGLGHASEEPSQDLWWRHEALHRTVLLDYERRRAAFDEERLELQAEAFAEDAHARIPELWRAHAEAVDRWQSEAARIPSFSLDPFARWWRARLVTRLRDAKHPTRVLQRR
jgi:secernin